MRLTLLHNLGAGRGFSLEHLLAELEEHGHELVRAVDNHTDVAQLRQPSIDAVVVAGGDATVATAVVALTGQPTPLAILPVGTANNIARSLGIAAGSLPEMIARWDGAREMKADTGVLAGAWGDACFVEGVGGGVVADGMAALSSSVADSPGDRDTALKRALEGFRTTLSHAEATRWTYRIDGVPFTEDLLLFEVLNMRSVGPVLQLSPDADPTDGRLSVVTAGEDQRAALDRYLLERINNAPATIALPHRAGTVIEIDRPGALHVDDGVRRVKAGDRVSLRVDAGSFVVLC
ncbi:MAG: diacylglycerol kinase family protein [Vicinamibacterales bacterium]